jgi:hypothetical protein
MAIKEFISLEGVDEVKAQYAGLATSAEQTSRAISEVGGDINVQNLNVALKQAGQGFRETESGARTLTESLHVLRPVLQELGVHVGGLREFSVLARGGLEGLAVAIAGAATIALIKFNDSLQQTQAILGDFLGSQARGAAAFAAISDSVDKVGSSATAALPGIESLIEALQKTGAVGGGTSDAQIRKITEAFDGLFAGLRAGHASITEANAAWTAFTAALSQQGAFTGKVAETLAKFPGALTLLKQAFNQGQLSNQQFIAALNQTPQSIEATIAAMRRISALLPESFDPAKPQSFADAVDLIWESFKKGLGTLSAADLKSFEDRLGSSTIAARELGKALTAIGAVVLEGATSGIADINREIENGQRFIANYSALWTQFKVLITTPVDASGTTAPIVEQFSKLTQMFQDMKRTGFALPELDPKSKQDLEDATKDVKTAKTAFEDFSRTQFGKGQFVTIGVQADTKPAEQQLVQFTESPLGKGKFVTVEAKVDFPEGVPLPQPKPADLAKLQEDAKAAFTELFNDVQRDASAEGEQLAETLGKPIDFSAMVKGFGDTMQGLIDAAGRAWERYKEILTQQIIIPAPQVQGATSGSVFEAAPPGTGGAGGGLITGPGSTTSDSILARLSNFEYVVRASAVKFYGVDLMHALNAMQLPRDWFKGFNLGGLVLPPFPLPPRFATGGPVAAQGRSLTLVLDGRAFALAGSKSAVDELERAADLHNLSRMGRAPGWVR